jgi:F-type H+-transporting ATPase subunit a
MGEHPFTFFEHYLPGVDHHNLHIVTAGFVVLLLALATAILFPRLRKAKENVLPDRKISLRSMFELFLEMLAGLCDDIIGHGGRKYLPFVGTIFLFIFTSNLIGLIPGFLPPTENWVTGAAVATISFLAYHYFGFRENGIGYLKHFIAPVSTGGLKNPVVGLLVLLAIVPLHVLFGSIEILSSVFRPITLSIRLFANIFADHTVLSIFSDLVPFGIPVIFLVLGLFVSFMQAFIFTVLSTVYISGAVAHEH